MFLKKMSAKQDEKSIFALDCLNFGVGLNLKSHSNQEIQINKAMKINLINKIDQEEIERTELEPFQITSIKLQAPLGQGRQPHF